VSLTGKRVLVVGASSGIGKAVAADAVAAGAEVAVAARREELLDARVTVAGDVREPAACERIVEQSVAALGGLDALVYVPAYLPLGTVARTDVATWREVFETNVIGAALLTRTALPHLVESSGRAAYLSSDSVPRPRAGIVPYTSSKAALDTLVAGLRVEAPEVCFIRVVLGPTMTGVPPAWDAAEVGPWLERWVAEGHLSEKFMEPEQAAAEVLHALASPVCLQDVTVQP
jgi:NAD(P)-dependent dehydrogenase (short-subunit alcohol dehydrogenase family)